VNVEDLLEQIICDRIEMLLNKRLGENRHDQEKINGTLEEILKRLDKKSGAAMEQFWEECIMQSAEENRYLYLSGIKDGARILKIILEM
jgi:hypothetical protein